MIEVKYAENGKYDQVCEEAMKQIETNGYVEALKQDGMEFVVDCRRGKEHGYDMVEGPMADDQIWDYLRRLYRR